MSLSTLINGRVQTPVACWKFELSPSFRQSPNINYICVPTHVELKKKIIFLLQQLSFLPCQSVLAQFWAVKETGNSILLTTTSQPFGLWGENKKLESYHRGCVDNKLYVHPKEGVAFGLSGRVFLNRTPEQTQDVHNYPKDQRPPCDDQAIFMENWGSFAVPLIEKDECFGVLEFVLDTGNISYDDDIVAVCTALKHVGFQSSFQTSSPIRSTYINTRKRSRTTSSSDFTSYCRLVPYFGLSSADAAIKLQETLGRPVEPITPGTFRNACRSVGICEWPWIPKRKSSNASSNLETQVDPYAYETSSLTTSIASDYMPNRNMGISEWSYAQTMTNQVPLNDYRTYPTVLSPDVGISDWSYAQSTTTEASLSENVFNQIPYDATSFPLHYNTEHMESDATSFWNPVATQYSSFGATIDTEDIGFPYWSSIHTLFDGAPLTETMTNQSDGCIEHVVESQHARDDFMQVNDEMEDLDVQDKITHMIYDFDKWANLYLPNY